MTKINSTSRKIFQIVEWMDGLNNKLCLWRRHIPSIYQTKIIMNKKEIDLVLSISSIWRFIVCLLYKKIAFRLRILYFKKRFNFFSPRANQLEIAKSFIFFLIRYLFKSFEISNLSVIFSYLLYQKIIIRKFVF